MSKTLFLHIGHYKTGTTALQIFLERSTKLLNASKFEYPDIYKHHSKHSAFAFSILRAAGVEKIMFDYSNPTPPQAMWGTLFDHIRSSRLQNTLISSEEFMRIGQFPKAADILQGILDNRPPDLNVKAIVYLRAPGSHVASWHNQLIKMNFPVADLNAALDGDIEDIHFDYRRALEPWMTVLGRDNVIIRPYAHNLDTPTALHYDLCKSVGINAAEGAIQVAKDPNPRFDDRVTEIVRLMQNMKFPRATINAIRNQVVAYLAAQDAVRYGGNEGVSKARTQAKDALSWLSEIPDCPLPLDDFATSLPTAPDSETVNAQLLVGFVYSELIQLRQRVNNYNVTELETRVAALEAKLEAKDKPTS